MAALLLCLRHLEKHDRLFSCKADPDTLTWFEQGLVKTGDAERSKKIVFCRLATGPRKPRVPVRAKDCVSEGGPLSRPTRRPPTLWHVVILGPEQPRCALGSGLPGPTFSSTRKRDLTAVSGMRLQVWTWILPVAERAPNDPGTSERRLSPAVVNPSSPGAAPSLLFVLTVLIQPQPRRPERPAAQTQFFSSFKHISPREKAKRLGWWGGFCCQVWVGLRWGGIQCQPWSLCAGTVNSATTPLMNLIPLF